MYEFNRAYCNIKLDPAFEAARPPAPELLEAICADLEIAAASEAGLDAIEKDATVTKAWLRENATNPRLEKLKAKIAL
jgi:hypothetical protein